ncbi:MAG: C13 family peptidase [Chloroflexota bacterium]
MDRIKSTLPFLLICTALMLMTSIIGHTSVSTYAQTASQTILQTNPAPVLNPRTHATDIPLFGDGRDGAMPTDGNLDNDNGFGVGSVNGMMGATNVDVTNAHHVERINPGDVVLLHQTQGEGAGCWELNRAASDFGESSATYTLANPLQCTYTSDEGSNHAQILRVPQYATCTVTGTVTPLMAWDGTVGGIFAVMCNGEMQVTGTLHADGYGFRGTSHEALHRRSTGTQGEGLFGIGSQSAVVNGNGGGGGEGHTPGDGGAGGGGGNGSKGEKGDDDPLSNHLGGRGGGIVGNSALTNMHLGGAGGEGGADGDGGNPGGGGDGGGIIAIFAQSIQQGGALHSNGDAGGDACQDCGGGRGIGMAGGGGGAGGSIFIQTDQLQNSTSITAQGGSGGQGTLDAEAGAGGSGRIRIEYCSEQSGVTAPVASVAQISCNPSTPTPTATPTSTPTAPNTYGDGRDGEMPTSGNLDNDNGFGLGSVSGTVGATSVNVTNAHHVERINPGDVVLLHQTQGAEAGCWELNRAGSDFSESSANYTLENALQCTYTSDEHNHAQILRVPQYTTCAVTGTVTPLMAWDGTVGGIFAVLCNGELAVRGTIHANGYGFRGTSHNPVYRQETGTQGEGSFGVGSKFTVVNGNGGGGGEGQNNTSGDGGAGGGGGNGSQGEAGDDNPIGSHPGGQGGGVVGNSELTSMHFGGAGGEGGADGDGGAPGGGGNGGGIIAIFAQSIDHIGAIDSNGAVGGDACQDASCGGSGIGMAGGGGGAGGSIFIQADQIHIKTAIYAQGGRGGKGTQDPSAGAGGEGRIRIEYCTAQTGFTAPAASVTQVCSSVPPTATATPTATAINTPMPTSTATPTLAPPSDGLTDAYEPDDSCDAARPINTIGVPQQYTFHDAADSDWATFTAPTAGVYLIDISVPTGSRADVDLSYYTACAPESQQGTVDERAAPGAKLEVNAAANQQFFIKLNHIDTNTFGPNVRYELSIRKKATEQPTGAVIIVAGRRHTTDSLQDNINRTGEKVYHLFQSKGVKAEDILFLATDPELAGYDDLATASNLRDGIREWAAERVSAEQALTLYLIDHGERDLLYLDDLNEEYLTPTELDGWLHELEEVVPGLKVNVIVEACYSGSFIDPIDGSISRPGRLIITTTSDDSDAYASDEGIQFSDTFITRLHMGDNLPTAFSRAREAAQRNFTFQDPWLDGDGDGIPNEDADVFVAATRGFEYGGTLDINKWPPFIIHADPPTSITDRRSTFSVEVRDDQGVKDVWAVVYPPDYTPPTNDGELNPQRQERIPLSRTSGNDTEGVYTTEYEFIAAGVHHIFIHATDNDDLQAQPVVMVVDTETVTHNVYLPTVKR